VSESAQVWIYMELTPLDSREAAGRQAARVFWQPETGILEGPDAERIRHIVNEAVVRGYVVNSRGEKIAVEDPLRNTAQFSAVLSQFFWVSPRPVTAPDLALAERDGAATSERKER